MKNKKHPGRPKMAKGTQKQAFPLRISPDLIKRISKEAKVSKMKVGPYAELVLRLYHEEQFA